MNIVASNLGFREMYRLTQFIEFMTNNHSYDCAECEFSYDLKYDEPIIMSGFNKLYASDYNIAFTSSNELTMI